MERMLFLKIFIIILNFINATVSVLMNRIQDLMFNGKFIPDKRHNNI